MTMQYENFLDGMGEPATLLSKDGRHIGTIWGKASPGTDAFHEKHGIIHILNKQGSMIATLWDMELITLCLEFLESEV